MLPRVGDILMVVISNIVTISVANIQELPPLLPNTFKDVFVGALGSKPVYGTTSATCWARGGVCVDIRECPMLKLDAAVPGCTRGFKVCCKSFKLQPPTVGIHRRDNEVKIYSPNLEELDGKKMETMAANNNNLLLYLRDYPNT